MKTSDADRKFRSYHKREAKKWAEKLYKLHSMAQPGSPLYDLLLEQIVEAEEAVIRHRRAFQTRERGLTKHSLSPEVERVVQAKSSLLHPADVQVPSNLAQLLEEDLPATKPQPPRPQVDPEAFRKQQLQWAEESKARGRKLVEEARARAAAQEEVSDDKILDEVKNIIDLPKKD